LPERFEIKIPIVEPAMNAGQFNYYSKVLHENSIDGLCYGFAFDDVYFQHSGINVNAFDEVFIEVMPF